MPPHAPSATPRRFAGTAALRMVRVKGVTIAAPAPCTARATMSIVGLCASADAAEPSVKIARPIEKMRRLPNRSPSAAPVSRRTANVSVYALIVHSSCCRFALRSCRITGSAVVTTRLSRVTMNNASEVIANVQMTWDRRAMMPYLLCLFDV